MPRLRSDPPIRVEPVPFAKPFPSNFDADCLPPEVTQRFTQLSKAAAVVAEAADKLIFDLHNFRIHEPAAIRIVTHDLRQSASRLSLVLNPKFLTHASDSPGRVDINEECTGRNVSENGRSEAP